MRPLRLVSSLVLPIATLVACNRQLVVRDAGVDHAARRAELLSQDRAAEARSRGGDFVGALSRLVAPEGVLLAPVPVLQRGPAAARASLERDALNARSIALWSVLRVDVSADGRDGYTYGHFDVVRPSGEILPGRYHAYWRRSDAGRWEILAMSRGRRPPGGERTAFPDSLERHRRYVAGPMRDTVAALRQLFAVEAEFSDSAGHGVGRAFRRFAAPDAGKLGPAGYLFGPAAIETIFDAPPPNSLGPAWTPEWGSVAVSNDLGFTLGPAWPRQPGPNQVRPEQTSGRYFSIWKRQPDGSWRYVVD